MFKTIFWMVVITFIPTLELRASIPFGFFGNAGQPLAPFWLVTLVCIVTNIILGVLVYALMGPVFTILRRWGWFERHIWPILDRTQEKLRPYVEKYGEMGVAVFIGVPLPGTGVYTGAFGSYLLGLNRRKFFVANCIGVLIAGVAVTALCFLLHAGVMSHASWVTKLLIKDRPAESSLVSPPEMTP